jgi:Ca2+/Na+ antiporter
MNKILYENRYFFIFMMSYILYLVFLIFVFVPYEKEKEYKKTLETNQQV